MKPFPAGHAGAIGRRSRQLLPDPRAIAATMTSWIQACAGPSDTTFTNPTSSEVGPAGMVARAVIQARLRALNEVTRVPLGHVEHAGA